MCGRLLSLLADDGPRADRIANVVCQIVVVGSKLGELEEVEITDVGGRQRTIRKPPLQWMERIATAAEIGAFDRLSDSQIVLHILSTPGPSHPEVRA